MSSSLTRFALKLSALRALSFVQHHLDMSLKPRIELFYCTQCRWLLRAAWLAQELLTTFEEELGGVTLIPSTGGRFEVRLEDALIWSRAIEGRFPEAKELKQRVRDLIAPDRALGHSDPG